MLPAGPPNLTFAVLRNARRIFPPRKDSRTHTLSPSPGGPRRSVSAHGRTASSNDPSAGSPTDTLLRLLLPLNGRARRSSRADGRAPRSGPSPMPTGPKASLDRSIGSSDGRCVQRAGTYSRRPRMSRHYGEFHVRGGRLQPPVPTVIEFRRLPGPLVKGGRSH